MPNHDVPILDEEAPKILAWVSPVDVSTKQYDVFRTLQPGTGEWLLESDTFQTWVAGISQALWLPGVPGAGKTVLASLIIEHLCSIQRSKPRGTIGVAWIYFHHKEESTQTPDDIHLSVARQLAKSSTELYTRLRSAYKEDPSARPLAHLLVSDARILMGRFEKVFIVIDALDECAEKYRARILQIMAGLQLSRANILITSRKNVSDHISTARLVDVQRINIDGNDEDIMKYVSTCIKEQTTLAEIIGKDPSLGEEIVQKIVKSCQGMFLMARFHMESLGKHISAGDVRDALKSLPTTFPEIYNNAMDRIAREVRSKQALRVLSYLIHARRLLTVTELQHFLAVRPGHTDFRAEYIPDASILVSICAGLVVMDDESQIIRLVHFTAQEYFDKIRASKFPSGDQEMGEKCLVYLSFNAFRNTSKLSDCRVPHALLNYIVNYWHVHILHHQEALRRLLFAAAGLALVVDWLIADSADINARDGTGQTPLICASAAGHATVVDLLINKAADVNALDIQGGEYGTALQAASLHGKVEIIQLLLEKGADPNIQGENGYGTALHAASFEGELEIVQLLLEKGADPNIQGGGYGTALRAASYMGNLEIVQLLLKKGADPNIQGGKYGTALHGALFEGELEVVRLLLEKGADPNIQGGGYGTALRAASYMGNLEIVRLLLEKGADPNIQGGEYGTALHAALFEGELEIVRLLLEKGADPNIQGENGGKYGTALRAASVRGKLEIVRLLLEKGADPNIKGGKYGTALQAASVRGKLEIVRLLLEKGADPNIQGGEYGMALHAALFEGELEIVQLLLEKGADPNIQGENGYGTALQPASAMGNLEIVQLLLEKGADPNIQGGEYGTALHAALLEGELEIVRLLLEKGADPNIQGGEYGTVLHAALLEGELELVRLLLEKGADPNIQGENGFRFRGGATNMILVRRRARDGAPSSICR
ncbi:Pfs, NACHT and ankyrin domain protein [Mycena olivaceomarginata]|nr:Pfs, NACHT and ankyrin domain protein [Mycena olivaceomarginata]